MDAVLDKKWKNTSVHFFYNNGQMTDLNFSDELKGNCNCNNPKIDENKGNFKIWNCNCNNNEINRQYGQEFQTATATMNSNKKLIEIKGIENKPQLQHLKI